MTRYRIQTMRGATICEVACGSLAEARRIGRAIARSYGGRVRLLEMKPAPARAARRPSRSKTRAKPRAKSKSKSKTVRRRRTRKPRRNPEAISPAVIEQARRTFRRWHAFDPTRALVVPSRPAPKVVVLLGEIHAVEYESNKWTGRKQRYRHVFKRPRPLLCTSPDARGLNIQGGGFKVTDRGLVD